MYWVPVIITLLMAMPAQAEGLVSAAGRVEKTTGEGSCSAILVRPDLIATAAHCRSIRKKLFRPGDGLDGATYEILDYTPHPLYDNSTSRIDWKMRFDIAVGRLATPVPAERATPLPIGEEAQPGERLFIVSWRGNTDRPRQRACPVIRGVKGLVTLGCRVQGGESGAPVLRKTADGLELVAIISSSNQLLEQPVAQASDVRLRLPPLFDIIDENTP